MSRNDKESYVVKKTSFLVIITIILVILIGLFSVYMYINSAIKPVDKSDTSKVEVEIPLGSSTSSIANTLEEKNIIKNAKVFSVYVKLKNKSDLQAGNYELSPSQTIDEVIEELQSGKLINEAIHKITIPEGKSLEEIAELYAKKFDFTKEDFIEVTEDEDFLNELIKSYPETVTEEILNEELKYPLEGYLYASTYEYFEEEPKIKNIVSSMVERTDKQLSEALVEKDMKMNPHEILTLASIIERESKFDEDRPKVSQVFLNRIDLKMKLQSDITVSYALGQHKTLITYDDLKVDSPYNTYIVEGLPVGPIDSPSIESIKAVITPEGKDFTEEYFYARPNGETLYTKTLEEHNRVKKQYEHEWQELDKNDE